MTFLHPGLVVAGALCVAIPIIIHLLLRRRRQPINWGAMRFLLQAYKKRRRRSRIEHLLLLLSRCLVILLLALAIGRPLLQGAGAFGAGATRAVYLLLDNSVTSALIHENETALEGLQEEALRIINGLGPGDRVSLITLGAPADPVVLPASGDSSAMRDIIRRVTPTDAASDFAGGLRLVVSDLEESRELVDDAIVILLSSFRAGATPGGDSVVANAEALEGIRLGALTPAADASSNVSIASVEPLRPVLIHDDTIGAGQVRVRLVRSGESIGATEVTRLRLHLAGDERADESATRASSAEVRWRAGQSEATANLSVAVDGLADIDAPTLIAEIDRDALESDNTHRRPLAAREALRVGLIARRSFSTSFSPDRLAPADWLRIATRPSLSAPVDLIDVEPTSIDAPTLGGLDAVLAPSPDLINPVGWRHLRAFVDNGGLLVLSPPAEVSVHLWADDMISALGVQWSLPREASTPAQGTLSIDPSRTGIFALLEGEIDELLRPVRVDRVLAPETIGEGSTTLLSMADGSPWLISSPSGAVEASDSVDPGRGLILYMASAPTLTWTNLPAMPLVIPLYQEILRQGVGGAASSMRAVAGAVRGLPSRVVEVRTPNDRIVNVDNTGTPESPIRTAGAYRLLGDAGDDLGPLAVNADVDAADVATQSREVVEEWLQSLGLDTTGLFWIAPTGSTDEAQTESQTLATTTASSTSVSLGLLIGAMFFALLEVSLASIFSYATREKRSIAGRAEVAA